MADKVLTYTVKVDGKEVEKTLDNIENFNERIGDLQKQIEKAPMGSKKYKELQGELSNVEGAFTEAKIKAGGLGDVLSEQPGIVGQLGQSFKGLKGGVKAVGTAFKALMANPIVALIAALTAVVIGLFKAFTSTKKGGEQLEQVMAGISAVMDVLRDRVLKIGGALVKFFTGDFKGALEDTKAAFTGLGSEIAEEFQIAANATKKLQEVEDRMRRMNVERAKQNALISEAKGRINDENLSYAEREAALEEVRVAEIALAQQEQQLAEERYNALKALADLSDSSKEQLDELAQAEAEMYRKQKETADKQKEIFDQQKALRDRRLAEEKAAAEKRAAMELEYNNILQQLNLEQIEDVREREYKKLEIENQAQIDRINALEISEEKKNELLLELDETYQIRKQALTDQYNEEDETKRQENFQKTQDAKMRDLEAELQLLGMAEQLKTDEIERKLIERRDMLLQNEELTENERKLIIEQTEKDIMGVKQTAYMEEEMLERQRVAIKQKALDDIISIAGAESKVGKAALIAKQILNAKELIMDIQKTITFSSQAAARSTVAVAEGTAQTAKIGFPQNIPMLIGYAAQAVGIVKAIRDAVRSAGGNAGGGSGGPGSTGAGFARGGMVTGPGTGTSDSVPVRLSKGEAVINARSTKMFRGLLSSMNEMGGGRKFASGGVVGNNSLSSLGMMQSQNMISQNTPIKTYVVASDVSNMNEMDRLTKTNSSI